MRFLRQLAENTYLPDLSERGHIGHALDLGMLAGLLASSAGSIISPADLKESFKGAGRAGISLNTVKHCLACLEDGFMIAKAPRYDTGVRRMLGAPARYVFEDPGLCSTLRNFSVAAPAGMSELALFNELRRRGFEVYTGTAGDRVKSADGRMQRRLLEFSFAVISGD